MRRDGTFIRTVAAGLARIPTATGLGIYDQDTYNMLRRRRAGYFEQANNDEALVKNMLIPITWAKSGINQLEPPPVEVLTKLPGAVYDAGVLLKTLFIGVSAADDYSVLASSEDDFLKLTAAMRKLKAFLFRPRDYEIRTPTAQTRRLADLGRFLKAILETESLEDITLGFDWMWNGRVPPSISVGSIITSQQWPNLRGIYFDSLPLHLAELQKFIENLKNLWNTRTWTAFIYLAVLGRKVLICYTTRPSAIHPLVVHPVANVTCYLKRRRKQSLE